MNMSDANRWHTASEQLVTVFRAVISDSEELLRATANEAGGKASAVRAKIEERLVDARRRLNEIETTIADKARHAAKATDALVHERPWQAVGAAAAVGFLIGMLVHRR